MKNLVLISLDTVRADVAYSGKFSGIEILRNNGTTFLNTISSSPLTPVSHATVLTGLQPYHHSVRHLFKEKIDASVQTLAEKLKSEGYTTAAIVSCPGMNNWYGLNRGFDHYDDEIPKLVDGTDSLLTVDVRLRGTALKRANVVVERAKDWLKKNKGGNFFLFLHFFDAHWPYKAPEKFGGDNEYEEEIAFVDHYLKNFLGYLKQENLFDESIIIVFSDHGEDLEGKYPNDKGGEKLGRPEESGHGCLLYNQTQKVILIIKSPLLPKKTIIYYQVRLVDIVPTVLDLLNIKSKWITDGQSLVKIANAKEKKSLVGYCETYYPEEQTEATGGKFSNTRNKIAYFLDNRFKVIKHLGSDDLEIYDLMRDPNEKNNLAVKLV